MCIMNGEAHKIDRNFDLFTSTCFAACYDHGTQIKKKEILSIFRASLLLTDALSFVFSLCSKVIWQARVSITLKYFPVN